MGLSLLLTVDHMGSPLQQPLVHVGASSALAMNACRLVIITIDQCCIWPNGSGDFFCLHVEEESTRAGIMMISATSFGTVIL